MKSLARWESPDRSVWIEIWRCNNQKINGNTTYWIQSSYNQYSGYIYEKEDEYALLYVKAITKTGPYFGPLGMKFMGSCDYKVNKICLETPGFNWQKNLQ